MNNKKLFFSKITSPIFTILWAVVFAYCCVAFIPSIYAVGVGLEPSWTYGLNYAAIHRLVFGRDIIFTFGPLGYLVSGVALEQSFFPILYFQSTIHILFFGAVFFKLIYCKTLIQKIALFSATLFYSTLGGGIDNQIVLLALLVSLNDKLLYSKHLRKWALLLGLLSGLTLLSKFTIGVGVFGIFIIFLSSGYYQSIESKLSSKLYVLVIADFLIATISTLIIFLNPDRLQGSLKILICFAIAGCTSLVIWFKQVPIPNLVLARLNIKFINHQEGLENKEQRKYRIISEYCFYLIYSLELFFITLYTSPSLLAYLKGCLEISSGYSSAMVLVGSNRELVCAIFIILLIMRLVALRIKAGDFSISLCLSLVLYLNFKLGFTRADGHVAIFAAVSPFLIAVCLTRLTSKKAQFKGFFGYVCTLIIILFGFSPDNIGSPGDRLLQSLAPDSVLNQLTSWTDPFGYKTAVIKQGITQLSEVRLPVEMRNLIGNQPVDIVPWDASLVGANDLNWKPRPVFQSYAAYTQFLDNANFESLSKVHRDYIIYSFQTIDGRHPFFDEPRTFFNLLCNYKTSSTFPNFYQLSELRFVLLEKRQANICSPSLMQQSKALSWRTTEVLNADNQSILRASFKFRYSLFGKVYKALFRAAPIKINVNYIDGSRNNYRIVPDNAINGIVLSHLAKNEREVLSLFNSNFPLRVKSFSLSTANPLIYQNKIEVQLTSHDASGFLDNQPSFIDIARLKNINFLPAPPDNTIGNLDFLVASKSRSTISLGGWAMKKDDVPVGEAWLLITGGTENKPLGILRAVEPRPDVAKVFRDPRYALSGWSGNLNASELPKGYQAIKVWLYDPDTNSASLIAVQSVKIK